ncbi:hypothetical protein [Lactococcus lactis]|uniref:Uncharacterized protein n=1 Tax=Lactococcus lactis TaxID=1358 RepID=A0AAP3Z2Y7_9LACT|nr:hypothetical protein [Lactococcus lactis]MDG4977333.1 hypothetical protein [Lactococcus lactis]
MKHEIDVVTSLEDKIRRGYLVVRNVNGENYNSSFGTAKYLYENNTEYKQLVDEWEQIQKEISPRVLMLVMKVLNLRAGWNIEEMNKLN